MGKVRAWAAAAMSTAALLAGCGGGSDLGAAFCSDLKAGATPFQILREEISGADDVGALAARAYVWARDDCPGQLEDNEALRSWLAVWGFGPDA